MDFTEEEKERAWELIGMALEEDLGDGGDVTTRVLIPENQFGSVQIVARKAGVLAGLPVAAMVFKEIDPTVDFTAQARDGDMLAAGSVIAEISGRVTSLLMAERTCLNFLTHLSGVATLTRRYVAAIEGTRAAIYDTRKTLPGWRVMQKYAVRAGGGRNHRQGLGDMVLIKDNHLAGWRAGANDCRIAAAVLTARAAAPMGIKVEVEVDTLEQLADVLSGKPDIVLLDNMTLDQLRQAVALRNQHSAGVELEASGGVSLETVATIAATGVERISVGALTHSAPALDLAFDWK
jgi:nicotinate-nucleotide pyrophosphorylase (carboxylating)